MLVEHSLNKKQHLSGASVIRSFNNHNWALTCLDTKLLKNLSPPINGLYHWRSLHSSLVHTHLTILSIWIRVFNLPSAEFQTHKNRACIDHFLKVCLNVGQAVSFLKMLWWKNLGVCIRSQPPDFLFELQGVQGRTCANTLACIICRSAESLMF